MENETLDISKMDIQSLEALAYRLVKQLNNIQQNLNIVEQEIQKRATRATEPKVKDEPVAKTEAKK